MPPLPDPFWLCHECGAQMRPIERESVKHCASCDGEFLEILDNEINPDPFHELPPQPPVRPSSSPPPGSQNHDMDGGFMQSLLGNLFGAAAAGPGEQREEHAPPPPSSGQQRTGGSNSSGHTYTFNIGNNGQASVTFGSFGGAGRMGPFGPVGGDRDEDDLEDFFPGFGVPRPGSQPGDTPGGQRRSPNPFANHPMAPHEDLIQALMGMFMQEGAPGFGPGRGGRGNFGDYVMTDQGFDRVLEHLMQAAGPQGPIPASDVVINGLPRFKLTEQSLEESTFKDCPVCKEDFEAGNEVMRIPCKHIFHPDCLEPWLRTNGSCPVCRFSLVPEDGASRPAQQAAPDQSNQSNQPSQPNQLNQTAPSQSLSQPAGSSSPTTHAPSMFAGMLQRLWGQSGSTNPPSPMSETRPDEPSSPSHNPATQPSETVPTSGERNQASAVLPHSGLPQPTVSPPDSQPDDVPNLSSAIPEDYRERHRRREQQQQQQQQAEEVHQLHEDLD